MDPYLGEIRMFAGNYAPQGWAQCNGQILSLSQNTALFALLGTFYGGDGKSTFALPDLRGRVPLNQGQGAGLPEFYIGEEDGTETVSLTPQAMPAHSHGVNASTAAPLSLASAGADPSTSALVPGSPGKPKNYTGPGPSTPMSPLAIGISGGDQPHNNMAPTLAVNFIIALQGVFPPRS